MGFFSGIGNAIKNVTKAVSIDNVIKVATGNAGAVVADVIDRAKDGVKMIVGSAVNDVKGTVKNTVVKNVKSIVAGSGGIASNAQLIKTGGIKASLPLKAVKVPASVQYKGVNQTTSISQPASKGVGEEFLDYLTDFWGRKIDKATGELIQDALKEPVISSFMDRFKKEALKFYWWKYKPYFVVGGLSLAAFLVYWFKFRKPKNARRRR